MRAFAQTFELTGATRILDVGGTPELWGLLPVQSQVILANMPRAGEAFTERTFQIVAADARALPFPDKHFDIVFSNSVIEHVGSAADQARCASEIRRVGKHYWVQTPNRNFPIEAHLLTPFIHWLPKKWAARIIHRFTIWEWITKPRPDQLEFYLNHFLNDIHLLTPREMLRLFPGAVIRKEKLLGWTKSLVAVK